MSLLYYSEYFGRKFLRISPWTRPSRRVHGIVYSCDLLLPLPSTLSSVLCPATVVPICQLSLNRRRRAGRHRHRLDPVLRPVGNGATVVTGNRPARRSVPISQSLTRLHVDRHSAQTGLKLVFGCLNVRSLTNKVDDLRTLLQEQSIDVMLLTETWHDADSISIRRFRTEGFNVIEHARPRVRDSTQCVQTMAVSLSSLRVEHV